MIEITTIIPAINPTINPIEFVDVEFVEDPNEAGVGKKVGEGVVGGVGKGVGEGVRVFLINEFPVF